MIAPQAAGKRNEIARMLTLGAGPAQRPIAPPLSTYAPPPLAAVKPVPYSEAGFGYGDKTSPLEELGMAWAKRK